MNKIFLLHEMIPLDVELTFQLGFYFPRNESSN